MSLLSKKTIQSFPICKSIESVMAMLLWPLNYLYDRLFEEKKINHVEVKTSIGKNLILKYDTVESTEEYPVYGCYLCIRSKVEGGDGDVGELLQRYRHLLGAADSDRAVHVDIYTIDENGIRVNKTPGARKAVAILESFLHNFTGSLRYLDRVEAELISEIAMKYFELEEEKNFYIRLSEYKWVGSLSPYLANFLHRVGENVLIFEISCSRHLYKTDEEYQLWLKKINEKIQQSGYDTSYIHRLWE